MIKHIFPSKYVGFGTSVLVLCFVFYYTSSNVFAQNNDALYIVTENYPPYEMSEPQNELRGFDYEVATEIFKQMGYRSKIDFLPWGRVLMLTRKGKTVGVLTCAKNKERSNYIIFSDPISDFTHGFFVRSEFQGPVPKSLRDVRGQKIASIKGYESQQELLDAGLEPLEVTNTPSAIKTLLARRFDYLYVAEETTAFTIKNMGHTDKFAFHPLGKKSFHFCFSKNYPNVEKIVVEFNETLAKIKLSGWYDEIHAKYR
ncbi:substrate-binding periplasmic protein [Kiloniella antarctica]|uniref:Substrate-binding periplasmic protein n=1 Tax=Kiloniella antarctica TaxID=1550907 RepID=A0ABW5BJ20_9PROT